MWKWGVANYKPEISLRYLNVDPSFRTSLNGLSKHEVKKWFPDLRTETKPQRYLDTNEPFFISNPDFLWIGDSQWAIEFHDGKVSGFALIKGWPKPQDRRAFSEGI